MFAFFTPVHQWFKWRRDQLAQTTIEKLREERRENLSMLLRISINTTDGVSG